MDYEKEYKKLKAGISKAYLYAQTDSTKAVLENILPELTENEDERTRRSLIDAIKIGYSNNGISFTKEAADRYIAWLEKQKEQKPVEHSAKGRRGRMGGIPEYVRRKAEAFKDKMEPPYDADDICTAYETGAMDSINCPRRTTGGGFNTSSGTSTAKAEE